jgi:transposase
MARSQLVDDGLCELVKPLLPDHTPQRTRRPRVSDRTAFTATVFVLVTGMPWRMVPRQIGCSGVTAWRRLREWQRAGVWERLRRELLRRLNAAGRIDWSRGSWTQDTSALFKGA